MIVTDWALAATALACFIATEIAWLASIDLLSIRFANISAAPSRQPPPQHDEKQDLDVIFGSIAFTCAHRQDKALEAIPCEVLAYLCLREQESFLTPHIAPASTAIDASQSLSLSGRVRCIRLMLCLTFYEWSSMYSGDQMILAPFMEKSSPDRAPGRFAGYLFAPKHPPADVLLTTVLGPLRSGHGRRCWKLRNWSSSWTWAIGRT